MSKQTENLRRSGRARVAPKKYTVDPFAGIEKELYSASEQGLSEPTSEVNGSDAEFDQDAVAETAPQYHEDETDDEEYGESEAANSGDDDEDEEGTQAEYDNESVIEILDTPSKPRRIGRQQKALSAAMVKNEIHSMGLAGFHARIAKEERVIAHVGTGEEDIIAHVKFRDEWQNRSFMPERAGLGRSVFYPPEKRYREATEGFQWYYELGGDDFCNTHQVSRIISKLEAQRYSDSLESSSSFLIGTASEPNLIQLKHLESTTLAEAFRQPGSESVKPRTGWILNVSSRVQCLEWAPNRNGVSQFLLVSTRPFQSSVVSDQTQEEFTSPFQPQLGRRSSFQLWEFDELNDELDPNEKPRLRAVVSYDWNDAKQFKWCPAPLPDVDVEDEKTERLGFLAGVWMDGCVRVLDIVLPKHAETVYLHVSEAFFESRPPGTVCTTLTWLSTRALAAGCANGHVAIWDVPSSVGLRDGNLPLNAQPNPKPWLYRRFHDTYIMNMTCGYPSRPYALFTNSVDGHTRLTDLRDPVADAAYVRRVRVNQPAFVWHDPTQQLIRSDENSDLLSHYLRVFHAKELVMRWTALVTDIAASELHPIILCACADGTVGAVNMAKTRKRHHVPTRQIWFRYEWRNAVQQNHDVEIDSTGDTEMIDTNISQQPLGRFLDGFKVERIKLDNDSRHNFKDGASYNTIYEQPTHISRVTWNPNLGFGTYAAASTGNGLIRIEDLAID